MTDDHLHSIHTSVNLMGISFDDDNVLAPLNPKDIFDPTTLGAIKHPPLTRNGQPITLFTGSMNLLSKTAGSAALSQTHAGLPNNSTSSSLPLIATP